MRYKKPNKLSHESHLYCKDRSTLPGFAYPSIVIVIFLFLPGLPSFS